MIEYTITHNSGDDYHCAVHVFVHGNVDTCTVRPNKADFLISVSAIMQPSIILCTSTYFLPGFVRVSAATNHVTSLWVLKWHPSSVRVLETIKFHWSYHDSSYLVKFSQLLVMNILL